VDGSPAQFHGDPLLVDGIIISGSDRSSLAHTYAFDIASGEVLWKHGGSALESDIVPAGGYAVGRRWNGDLLAVDIRTGERIWSLQPEDYLYRYRSDRSPVAQNDTVFFGGVDGRIQAVDGQTGSVIWSYDTGDAVTSSLTVVGNDVYAGLANRDLLRLSASDGELLGAIELEKSAFGRPAVASDVVMVMTGRGDLVALARDLSTELWRQDGDPRWTTPQPLVWKDLVIVGTTDGLVNGFRTGTGEPALELTLEGRIRGLGACDDVLYVGTLNGNLFACRPKLD